MMLLIIMFLPSSQPCPFTISKTMQGLEGVPLHEHSSYHAMHKAAYEGNIAAIHALLVSELEALELRDHDYYTPLHCVVFADKPEAVRVLLATGADPPKKGGRWNSNAATGNESNAVIMAAVFGCERALEVLLESSLQVPLRALVEATAVNRPGIMRIIASKLHASQRDFQTSRCQTAFEKLFNERQCAGTTKPCAFYSARLRVPECAERGGPCCTPASSTCSPNRFLVRGLVS